MARLSLKTFLGCVLLLVPVLEACSSDSESDEGGPGQGGASSGGASAGSPGGGSGGQAMGGPGAGGMAGTAGNGGTSAGMGGMAGGTGGTSAGTGGASGTVGSGGTPAGTGGTAGPGGTGGTSAGTGGTAGGGAGGSAAASLSFFVSSTGSPTAAIGGLAGADARCQTLAAAVGQGNKTWRAYLSVAQGPGGQPVHAKDRIGTGPWYNAKGALVAMNLQALHPRQGVADLFIDEKGQKIPGQWQGSPSPVQHDILTGSKADGTLDEGNTCSDWTSAAMNQKAAVGHSDGLGPGMSTTGTRASWNAAHLSGSCGNTALSGGDGRVYCFAVN